MEEIALLLGSSPTTKKVQSIFEEAQKIREAEEIQEIELGWQGSAQRSLGHASPAVPAEGGLEKALTAAAKPEGSAPTEPARAEAAPADGPEREEEPALEAAAVPARKRGRPKKTEGGEKEEKKQAAGKRQKSLFDF